MGYSKILRFSGKLQTCSKGIFCADDSDAHHAERFNAKGYAPHWRFASGGHEPEDQTKGLLVFSLSVLDGACFEGCRWSVCQGGFRGF
jgi:hypothetical protein